MNIEKQRKVWSKVAKDNVWYKEPFFVQVWINKDTKEIILGNLSGFK